MHELMMQCSMGMVRWFRKNNSTRRVAFALMKPISAWSQNKAFAFSSFTTSSAMQSNVMIMDLCH